MKRPWLGSRQPLGSATISRLPPDALIALAIGLEHDAFAVPRPDGRAIVAAKGQAADRTPARQFVDRDSCLLSVEGLDRQPLPVGDTRGFEYEPRGDGSGVTAPFRS